MRNKKNKKKIDPGKAVTGRWQPDAPVIYGKVVACRWQIIKKINPNIVL